MLHTKKNVSIIYLWSIVTGYITGVLEELSEHTSGTIDVIHWDKKTINDSQFKIEIESRVNFHKRSDFNESKILNLIKSRNPDIIVVSGWMDKGYLRSISEYKKFNLKVKIVCGIDDLWLGTLRQNIGRVYFHFFYRKLFDYMWVSGKPQFSYAQKFGYNLKNIISNLYSADSKYFKISAGISKRFIFVGRFVEFKSIENLVIAYSHLPEKTQKEWPLILIGDGDKRPVIASMQNQNIMILPFLQTNDLINELKKGGVACLPSYKEHWGVVVHEFCSLGLPIILSDGVGSSSEFLISGYNGFVFKKGSIKSLTEKLEKITSMSNEELVQFGLNSKKLSNRINNEFSAFSLLSII